MDAQERPEPPRIARSSRPGSLAEFDAPDSVWNRAAAESAQGDPFCCRTEWSLSFHEAFHPRRPLHLRTDGSSVVAFAERVHFEVGHVLEPLESMWLFGCPLLGPHGLDLLDAFFEERSALGAAPHILLSGLLPASPLLRLVARTFASRCEILHLEPALLVSASLAGGLDGWLARRSGHFRRRLRHAAQRAAARGVRFERCVPRSARDAEVLHERMLAVERASWKGIGRCGMAEPPARDFYGRMLHRLALAGAARVMFARHGDGDIGFVFGGLAGAVYRGQQFSFAEDWRASSIGNLLQFEQIRWLGEESAVRYDMGPLMDYKRHWTETTTRIEARLLRPKARAR